MGVMSKNRGLEGYQIREVGSRSKNKVEGRYVREVKEQKKNKKKKSGARLGLGEVRARVERR